MKRTAIRYGCVGVLLLAGCALPGGFRGKTGTTIDEENVLHSTLENGLKVVLVEDHSAPVVALNVWVRTGSADEQEGEFGMAHVFEHMLFKGTERRAVGEIARTVEAAGGNINAFTSFDMTVYHITMASRDSAEGVDVLADAVLNSTFDPAELEREMEVVVEEINRGEDSPGRVLSQTLFDLAYDRHPYGRPVIGTEESVRSFSREQMLDFHARWYVPNNTTFVAVGDLDPEAMLEQIRTAFADAEPRSGLEHPRADEPRQKDARTAVVRRPFRQTLFGMVFPITGFAHEDTPALDLLSMVLGAGESSRLYKTVKDEKRLVHAISASSYTPRDGGLFFVDGVLEPEHVEATIGAIEAELARMIEFGPTKSELERARTNLLSHEIHEKETVQGQARKYGYYETLADGMEQEKRYLDGVRAATPEDLRRVAEEYLRPERVSLAVLLPDEARPELDAAALTAALGRDAAGSGVAQAEELRDGIRRYELPNGLRLVVKQNAAVPLVSLRLSFLGGLLAETEETNGINSFLSSMLDRGTTARSAAQFSAEVEDLAASVEGFSGRNSFGLTGEFLKDTLDNGLELFADALLHPAFDTDEIEKLRIETLAALERREDALAQKAFELFAQGLYADHPYRLTSLGTEESVKTIDQDALRAYYEQYAHPSNGVLSVVGDVDPDRIATSLARLLSTWTGPEKVELPQRGVLTPPARPREVTVEKKKQQVHVVMGFLGLSISDPDVPALEVLTQVLAGQGGRLFLELRDKKSLAYSVTAFAMEGLDRGSFGVYIASAPDKLEEARTGLRTELARIRTEPIAPAELERSRAYLIGTNAVSLQRYSAQAALLSLDELYGLGATHHLDYGKRIEAVTLEDLKRVAKRIIELDAPVVAVIE